MYGRTPERHFVRQTRSTIFWGILIPLTALLGLAWPTRGLSFILMAGYLLLYRRTHRYYAVQARLVIGRMPGCLRCWIVLAKFPHAVWF